MKSLFLISFTFLFGYLFAQPKIEAGLGFNGIQIGMSGSDLLKSEPLFEHKYSLEQEKKYWKDIGYEIDSELVFQIPFDEAYLFHEGNKHGLWTVYLKDKKVVNIEISKEYFEMGVHIPTIVGDVKFGAQLEYIESIFGDNYVKHQSRYGTLCMTYLEKGISFNIWEQGLTTLYIFAKMDSEKADILKKKLNGVSPAGN